MAGKLSWLITLALVCVAQAATLDDEADREAIRIELENLMHNGFVSTSDVQIASGELLVEIYERRNFLPAWNDQRQINELISVIRETAADGLDPHDYHLAQVEHVHAELLAGRLSEPAQWAAQDILLTDSLIRLGYHQKFGKVNPYDLDPNWNFRRELNGVDPATVFQEAIDAPSLTEYVSRIFPRDWVYQQLQAGLARYRQIEAAGGWQQIPAGPTLQPGASDKRMPLLAQRLVLSGDIAAMDSYADLAVYDEILQQGVRGFQERHGIEVDAVIGPATLRALNTPVGDKIRQLEINLERARWVLDDIGDNFIVVNIAGFRAYLVRDRQVVWKTRVQVGAAYHESPVFRDEVKYLVLNPAWTVPYNIATREILPQIKRNRDYLASRNFAIKDRRGNILDPDSIDWSPTTANNFPYWLVQGPGPDNALGRVKFMFPNEHAVYLHDTPGQHLFDQAERTFSHGCIRIENPFELAELLLHQDGWTQERFQAVLDSGESKTVFLSEPLPIYLLYWTALVDPDGVAYFYGDVYSRDEPIATALDSPFELELPRG